MYKLLHFFILGVYFTFDNVLNELESISNSSGVLFYKKYGSGTKVLIAFHGYNQRHDVFLPVVELVDREYTVYSFDIFFHENSLWHHNDAPITKEQWKAFFMLFLKKEGITNFGVIGYSMGGKLALATAEMFGGTCISLCLLAPDGLKINRWYKFAVKNKLGNRIFRNVVNKPSTFFGILRILRSSKLVPVKLINFAEESMKTKTERERIYKTWIAFQEFFTSPTTLLELNQDHETAIYIFLGRNDLIVKPKSVINKFENINGINIHVLNSGHGRLIEEFSRYVKTYDQVSIF